MASIAYPSGESGHLIYVTPQLTGNEPADVIAYEQQVRAAGERFPHQSTSDSWFDEAQFESYMKLGQHSAETMLADFKRVLLRTGTTLSPAWSAGLSIPRDLRPDVPGGLTVDPVLAPWEPPPLPAQALEPVVPRADVDRGTWLSPERVLPGGSAAIDSWWKPLVMPVAASVVATTSVIGLYDVFSETNVERRTDSVLVSREAMVIPRRERTILLPWFDERRPTNEDLRDINSLHDLSALENRLLELNKQPRQDTRRPGATLRAADIERIRRIAAAFSTACRVPITVRGLASSSQIADDDSQCGARPFAESTSVATRSSANRRTELIATILRLAEVPDVTLQRWDIRNPAPMLDAQDDDLDPGSDVAVTGRVTPGYSTNRGAFNRSVESICEGPCNLDLIQQRVAVMIVDRSRD